MKNNLGVTRWLVAPRAVVVQTGVILLLSGVVVGQNAERLWHLVAPPDAVPADPALVAQAAAGTMAPAPRPAARAAVPAAERVRAQRDALPDFTAVPARREPAGRALTGTERWVTSSSHDPSRRGYAVLAELRPGGSLTIERCLVPEGGAQSRCEIVLDQPIAVIGETQIDLGNGRSFHYSLVHRDGIEVLHLSLAEELELVPGTKASLIRRLSDLTDEKPTRGRWAGVSPRQRVARN